MGVSDGEEGGIGSDCPVGTIVWVRRRNGSWWPGRILGPEELSASHVLSPRSGTPVKLLGRDDASVDWYNLEKSKRVKAFRCGEFDSCIERAEASQGVPIRKREKYARREDAILHALELEKQQLEMVHLQRGTVSNGIGNKSSGSHRRDLNITSSNDYNRDDVPGVSSKFANKKSHTNSRKAVVSWGEENKGISSYSHTGKSGKLSNWEDENPETLPRMRGLQDFGLRIAPPKKKLSQSFTWETSRKLFDDHVDVVSNRGGMGASHTGSSSSSLAIKGKRSHGVNNVDSHVKKRDKRRQLVQVLQSSARLPVPHSFQSDHDTGSISMEGEREHIHSIIRAERGRCVYIPTDSNDSLDNDGHSCEDMPIVATSFGTADHPSPLPEERSSSSSVLAEDTVSDSSETDYLEPHIEEDGKSVADVIHEELTGSKDCDPPLAQASKNFRLNNNELPLSGYIPLLHPQDQLMDKSVDPGVSKWHMKGKRNIRNFCKKRPVDLMDGKLPFTINFNGSTNGSSFKSGHLVSSTRKFPFASQGVKDQGRVYNDTFNDSDSDSHMVVRRPYWEELAEQFDLDYSAHLPDEMEPMLIDVDINVQNPSHQGEHVPFVSLMSKFNGKQILGHPVQIEILEDGSEYDVGLDESYSPPAFGRTAKRTTMYRNPRSSPADSFDSDEEIKPQQKKIYAGHFNHQARLAKKSISHARRPTIRSKLQKKILYRVNNASQKTRKLSSLGGGNGGAKLNRSKIFNGLINSNGGAPLVTFVPVKVVFSRILEAIGKPRAKMGSPAVRGLS